MRILIVLLIAVLCTPAQNPGVPLTHNQGPAAGESQPQHATTIRMLAMFEDFGRYIGDREGRIQCWTCHKGQPKPERNQPKR